MKPQHLEITNIEYHRPGLNKIRFTAIYPGYVRRGVVVYDIVKRHFITHTHDIELLVALCISLQQVKLTKFQYGSP